MLLSDASVKDLSSKLEKDVTVERFRPNIIISDCEAFEEVCCSAFTKQEAHLQIVLGYRFPVDSSVWLQD